MTSVASPTLRKGNSEPSNVLIPECAKSLGDEAVGMIRAAGISLDPWEEFVLCHSLGIKANGKWAAPQVGLVVPRQNGKGEIILARQLVGIFLVGEKLITHSAHEFKTSKEHFRRVLQRLEEYPEFDRRIQKVSRSHGEEGVEFDNGARILFQTRTSGSGRGFAGPLVMFDEAMILPEGALAALYFTLSAQPNPQVWFTGSAVDQDITDHGIVLARLREQGHSNSPDLAFFEWCGEGELDDPATADNRDNWARANPGMGIRISEDHIARERRAVATRTFCVERLGIGDWPSLEGNDEDGISTEAWEAALDGTSSPNDPIVIAFDVRPNRSAGAIGMAGLRSDGKYHIEVIEHRKGTGWMPDLLAKLDERHRPSSIICDLRSPAASLLAACDDLGLNVETVGVTEHAQGCGMIFDAVDNDLLRHLDQKELAAAVRGATRRPLGDAWAWSRKSSAVDISPLVACTLALYGIASLGESVYEQRGILTVGS